MRGHIGGMGNPSMIVALAPSTPTIEYKGLFQFATDVPFEWTTDQKYNAPGQSVPYINLDNFKLNHEVLFFEMKLLNFANPAPINFEFKFVRRSDSAKVADIFLTVPTPQSQGYEWWNWYRIRAWIGKVSYEINGPGFYDVTVTATGGWSFNETFSIEVRAVPAGTILVNSADFVSTEITPAFVNEANGLLFDTIDERGSYCGMKIKMLANCVLKKVTKAIGCTANTAYLHNTAHAVLASAPFLGNDAIFDYALSAGTFYYVTAKNANYSGHMRTYHSYAVSPFPVIGAYLNWVAAVNGQNWIDDLNAPQNIAAVTVSVFGKISMVIDFISTAPSGTISIGFADFVSTAPTGTIGVSVDFVVIPPTGTISVDSADFFSTAPTGTIDVSASFVSTAPTGTIGVSVDFVVIPPTGTISIDSADFFSTAPTGTIDVSASFVSTAPTGTISVSASFVVIAPSGTISVDSANFVSTEPTIVTVSCTITKGYPPPSLDIEIYGNRAAGSPTLLKKRSWTAIEKGQTVSDSIELTEPGTWDVFAKAKLSNPFGTVEVESPHKTITRT